MSIFKSVTRQLGDRRRWVALTAVIAVVGSVVATIAVQRLSQQAQASPAGYLVQSTGSSGDDDLAPYFGLTSSSAAVVEQSLKTISENWHPGSAVMMIEVARFARSGVVAAQIISLTEAKTGQRFQDDFDKWHQWIWKQPYDPHPNYAQFKSALYAKIDPRFAEYYRVTKNSKIRLDEIRWGGVIRDGIPPLKDPKMITAANADYLADSDVVFGVDLNGDARCYPKRILAWHEMFKDTIGGESVCGVY